MQPAGPKITLCFPRLFESIYICVSLPYHVRNNYITYIVAMRPYLGWILRSRGNVGVTTWGSPKAEMPEVSSYSWCLPTEWLTNREWLPGGLLSGSEHWRPGWFLDMKYQTCFSGCMHNGWGYLIKDTSILYNCVSGFSGNRIMMVCNTGSITFVGSGSKVYVTMDTSTFPLESI